MRDARPRHDRAARRAGDFARDRDQPVRRRTRAHDDLDRRHPMAGQERHHPPPAPDPAQARHDRMPRRAADARTARAGSSKRNGRRRITSSATRRFWAASFAAKRLDELRRGWLNPPDLVDIVPEIIPTAAPGEAPRRYPDRIVPKNVEAAVKLKERTLTNLYNERPRWLADAHDALDRAVAAAYGWPEDVSSEGRAATPARPRPRTRGGCRAGSSGAPAENGTPFSSPRPFAGRGRGEGPG